MSKKHKPAHHPQPARANEFNPDYSQTRRDLRRIGILAVVFILLLVVLSFFQEELLAIFIH